MENAPSHSVKSSLNLPWEKERLIQVRTGKVKPVFGLSLESAIFKSVRNGTIKVNHLGCEGDEHAFEFHGGPDKALLQYCSQHYDTWARELPESSHLFHIGGFGENLVATHANERNVCIGDIIRIGASLIVQVSLPRQPCYKLNHRFQIQDMARLSQTQARTGWYYRVLQEGSIRAGDEMVLLKRPNPDWTVARVQHYLYIEMRNFEVMSQLVDIEGLGAESRGIFRNRLKRNFENQEFRLLGDSSLAMDTWADYRLLRKSRETPNILSLVFEAANRVENPEQMSPGTHIRIKLGGSLIRAYSVVSGNSNEFELGVALDRGSSRGGSLYLHDTLHSGAVLSISKFAVSFPLDSNADYHCLISGGVGITALLPSAQRLHDRGERYHLHYLVRTPEDIAFKRYLEPLGKNVTIYAKSAGNHFEAQKVIQKTGTNTHIYCCGSERLMSAVKETAEQLGIPGNNVHFEAFQASASGDPFSADLAESGKTVEVGATESLLDVLREAGFDIPSTCEAGNCGTCRVGVRNGRIQHRGTALQTNEKATAMLSCVSRGIGKITLDL